VLLTGPSLKSQGAAYLAQAFLVGTTSSRVVALDGYVDCGGSQADTLLNIIHEALATSGAHSGRPAVEIAVSANADAVAARCRRRPWL